MITLAIGLHTGMSKVFTVYVFCGIMLCFVLNYMALFMANIVQTDKITDSPIRHSMQLNSFSLSSLVYNNECFEEVGIISDLGYDEISSFSLITMCRENVLLLQISGSLAARHPGSSFVRGVLAD